MKETLQGIVVSDRMEKTRVIEVTRVRRHPLYLKEMKIRKKYKAHDEKNETRVGDLVRIMECRPLSKDKCWRVVSVIRPAAVA